MLAALWFSFLFGMQLKMVDKGTPDYILMAVTALFVVYDIYVILKDSKEFETILHMVVEYIEFLEGKWGQGR